MTDPTLRTVCPDCDSLRIRPINFVEQATPLNYFRCESCRHVWSLPKEERRTAPYGRWSLKDDSPSS